MNKILSPKSPRNVSKEDAEIGNRIRERREFLGITQSVLGNKLGITFQQVQKYENGVNRISAGRLVGVAKVLNISIGFFYSGIQNNGQIGYSILTQKIPADTASPAQSKEQILLMQDAEDMTSVFCKIKDPKIRRNFIKLVGDFATKM